MWRCLSADTKNKGERHRIVLLGVLVLNEMVLVTEYEHEKRGVTN